MLAVMFPIIYQAVAVHLDIPEMHSCCVREKNKFRKILVVFVVKTQCAESVKMVYQYVHVYQGWLEAHHHVGQNVCPVETALYNRLASIKSVETRVLEHVAVSFVLNEILLE